MAVTSYPRRSVLKPPCGSGIHYGHPLAANLQLAALLNERAGTKSNLAAGPGAAGTFVGGVTWSTGPGGNAVTLDGSNGTYVRYPVPPTISAGNPWSLVLRAKLNTSPSLLNLFNLQDAASNNVAIAYWYNLGNGLLVTQGTTADNAHSTELAVNSDITLWHSYAFTYQSGNTAKIYVDGFDQSTSSGAFVGAVSGQLDIGGVPAGTLTAPMSYQYFYLYNRSISPAEVAWLYAEPYAPVLPPPKRWVTVPAAAATVKFRKTLSGIGTRTGSRQVIGV
jgi:hypothetical protein